MLICSVKELPTALDIVASGHHLAWDFPLKLGARCTSFDGKRRCRNPCSRVAVTTTCSKHTRPEKIVTDWTGKRSAEWLTLAVESAKRPRKFCASYKRRPDGMDLLMRQESAVVMADVAE